ncbi:hypothetical protein EV356DRAFT_535735 [Viridothelium virens]|uniref:Uncharacterized protein n=1 Tax=Viridothelium virens TaxID=1048519 RepID=A0A6A6GZG0_VIRVR|nr:hypothetical protein EV356DRAFT_535735 [Viridothelium virens]
MSEKDWHIKNWDDENEFQHANRLIQYDSFQAIPSPLTSRHRWEGDRKSYNAIFDDQNLAVFRLREILQNQQQEELWQQWKKIFDQMGHKSQVQWLAQVMGQFESSTVFYARLIRRVIAQGRASFPKRDRSDRLRPSPEVKDPNKPTLQEECTQVQLILQNRGIDIFGSVPKESVPFSAHEAWHTEFIERLVINRDNQQCVIMREMNQE